MGPEGVKPVDKLSSVGYYRNMNLRKKIKEMKLEIKRLKNLKDYEYVIMDIQEEIKCLKKKLIK